MRRSFALFFAIIALLSVARWALGLHVDLIPDEAYYWSWSLVPDWCYWDQPAGVAWAIAGWRALFGDGLAGLRALAVCCALSSSLLAYALFRRALNERAAFWGSLALQTLPMFSAGAALIMHDSVLLVFGALAWLLWAMALLDDRPRLWPAIGLALTAALYAKFSAALLGLGFFVGSLADPTGRRHLRTPWPYLGGAVALALFSPVIAWNAQHRWVAYYAVVKLAIDPSFTPLDRLLSLLDFLGGQLLVATPVLAALGALGAVWAVRTRRAAGGSGRLLLATPGLVALAYFLWNSVRAKIEANWTALAWVGLIPLGVEWALARADAGKAAARRWLGAGAGLAAAATVAIQLQTLFNIAPFQIPLIDQIFGWDALAERVQHEREAAGDPRLPVACRTYQMAAELTRRLPDRPLVYTVDFPRRGSQFTLWEDFAQLEGRDVLYVDHWVMPRELRPHFASVTEVSWYYRRRGGRLIEDGRLTLGRSFHAAGPLAGYFRDPVGYHIAKIADRGPAEK